MTHHADHSWDEDRALVEGWIADFTDALDRRLPDRQVDERLSRITRRDLKLRDRLTVFVRWAGLAVPWRHRRPRAASMGVPRESASAVPPPSIDQIARELRRLDRQRRSGLPTQSLRWHAAVLDAYDAWLRVACLTLGIAEHLAALDGVDRDLERIRLECELQDVGLTVRPTREGPRS